MYVCVYLLNEPEPVLGFIDFSIVFLFLILLIYTLIFIIFFLLIALGLFVSSLISWIGNLDDHFEIIFSNISI